MPGGSPGSADLFPGGVDQQVFLNTFSIGVWDRAQLPGADDRPGLEVRRGAPYFAHEGEVTDATYRRPVLDRLPKAVTLYRPADQDQWLR